MPTPFDNELYKKLQTENILKKVNKYDKLYIEVGGKLFNDSHAARVLPGFDKDVKINIFKNLSLDLEVIICINANDIIRKKSRGDNGTLYSDEVLLLIEKLKTLGISTAGIVITFYKKQKLVKEFEALCKSKNIAVFKSYFIDNYPNDLDKILSKDGFGKNDYIKLTKKIVLVIAAGAHSGKLVTCLSQLYNDKVHGIKSGYVKYETFPIWNLPLNHLVNIAYEAATVDIMDKNMIDPYFKKLYHKNAVNYNRDIEAFPIVSNMLKIITGDNVYNSPTEMGINMAGFAIADDFEVQRASLNEIRRRYEKSKTQFEQGNLQKRSLNRSFALLKKSEELFKILENKKRGN